MKDINKNNKKVSPSNNKKNDDKQDIIQELLNSVLYKQLVNNIQQEENQLIKEYKINMESLGHIMSEYLSNYIVIGHDISGNEVVFSYAKTPNDKNANHKLFHDTFIRYMIAQQQNMG